MMILMIILNVGFGFKKEYQEGWVKVKDHNYITGKYGGLSHQKRNLNLILTKKILFCFIIYKANIHIFSFKKPKNIISK